MQPLASQGSADEAAVPSLSSESESSEDDTCDSSNASSDDVAQLSDGELVNYESASADEADPNFTG